MSENTPIRGISDEMVSFAHLVARAESGDGFSQARLGEGYEYGSYGLLKNGEESTRWFSRAVETFKKLAEQNDPKAQYMLGRMHRYGNGVVKDRAEAEQWFAKAAPGMVNLATKHDAEAQSMLSNMYEFGMGVPRNVALAYRWLFCASAQGDAMARFSFEVIGDLWRDRISKSRDPAVQVELGTMYEEGCGFEQSRAKAIECYSKAAETGYAPAQYHLGCAYAKIRTKRYLVGDWFQRAAEQGYRPAQLQLGRMYEAGYYGAGIDLVKATFWYERAGDKRALAELYFSLRKYREAFDCYRHTEHSQRNYPNIGLMYYGGLGVEEDDVAAALIQKHLAVEIGDRFRSLGNAVEAYAWHKAARDLITSFATRRRYSVRGMSPETVLEGEKRFIELRALLVSKAAQLQKEFPGWTSPISER